MVLDSLAAPPALPVAGARLPALLQPRIDFDGLTAAAAAPRRPRENAYYGVDGRGRPAPSHQPERGVPRFPQAVAQPGESALPAWFDTDRVKDKE